jgi:ATP-dependent helicase HrpB
MLALAGNEQGIPELGALLAALLSERDPTGIDNEADIRLRLEVLSEPSKSHPFQQGRFKTVYDLAKDILSRLPSKKGMREGVLSCTAEMIDHAGELLARAFPDRIGKRQENGTFRFISGREANIRGSLAQSTWLVAPDMDAGERNGVIYLAAPLSEQVALELLAPHLRREVTIHWNDLVPRASEITMAGRLVIREEVRVCNAAEAANAVGTLLKRQGLDILPWDEGAEAYTGVPQLRQKATARQLLDRIRFWAAHHGPDAPTVLNRWSDESLIAEAQEWLGPFIWNGEAQGSTPIITAQALYLALQERLGWQALHHLDELVPPLFISPVGTARSINYHSGEPVVSLKIQEVYGLSESPRMMGIPLIFELLSPAGRPIQITRDLGRFWSGSYAEVRKEMRGRYPKHDWPEDPSHAQAHAQVHSRSAKS